MGRILLLPCFDVRSVRLVLPLISKMLSPYPASLSVTEVFETLLLTISMLGASFLRKLLPRDGRCAGVGRLFAQITLPITRAASNPPVVVR